MFLGQKSEGRIFDQIFENSWFSFLLAPSTLGHGLSRGDIYFAEIPFCRPVLENFLKNFDISFIDILQHFGKILQL